MFDKSSRYFPKKGEKEDLVNLVNKVMKLVGYNLDRANEYDLDKTE